MKINSAKRDNTKAVLEVRFINENNLSFILILGVKFRFIKNKLIHLKPLKNRKKELQQILIMKKIKEVRNITKKNKKN